MKKSRWQSRRRHGRRSHQQNPWFRLRDSEDRSDSRAAQPAHDSSHGDDESPSTSSGTAGTSSVPELPGFYFDPEKKRYFRLLPGHNNCNPLTKESIRQKEMESKRLRLLQEEDRRKKADTNSDRLFTVNDVKVGGSKYGIINLQSLKTPTLKVFMHENLYFTNRKVNSVCWASLNHLDSHILLCLMGLAETPGCATLLPASLFVNSHPAGIDRPGMLCSFRIPGAWSCAWSLNIQANNCFSTGLSRRVLLTNVVTGHRQSFGTNSDVLAQQFALMAPLLFNGCRSGEIFAIDLRCGNQGKGWKATRLFHDSAVTSVRILQDEQYLMASDMAGKIKLWDLRTTKCVRQYEGHVNEYAYLPLHVHEEEGILVAVGQDCYTRIWSLHDARLLRTIPSPYAASKADIPSVAFSSRLGGSRGAPGLLMAVGQDLYCYSYS
ncbi:DCAF4 isoform 5 [Pan troglodytes]|uniref:DDB1- and CUL4-associated factor 4 n=2 Tax=Pan troglodytes TaxID=9598 RepID=A0A2I3RUV0_PANTR|nr:DDB1- and CUL4-associated factor 4 isoform X11 [Pan troglodytes]XP_057155737.1 DDB1- and CUL4-associated factor 4 isoform X5 [Pan paniscus]PNI84077.1 DCAF4 isoform 5 [Pan troglodytes]